jgi:hypothetical protein
MGTKNNPGNFDCYANADPDEPMFILLGRDPMAASLVEAWAICREVNGESVEKVNEALVCADAMRRWCKKREIKAANTSSLALLDAMRFRALGTSKPVREPFQEDDYNEFKD